MGIDYRTSTELGETETLRGYKQNRVCNKTQEKGAVIPEETEPNSPMSSWESPAEAWVDSGLPQGPGNCQKHSWKAGIFAYVLLEQVTISPTIDPAALT